MATELLALRTAAKHVENYQRESADLIAEHHDAMDCRDCEAFLQLGIDAFKWLIRADAIMRKAIYEGQAAYDPEIDKRIALLCREWRRPCGHAEQWIAAQQSRGYEIENLTEFRQCCGEMKAIVEAQDETGPEPLLPAVADLRDQALNEHLHGETSEFV